jgi:hypothetical protein
MTYLGRERATETNETHAAADAVSATLAAADTYSLGEDCDLTENCSVGCG